MVAHCIDCALNGAQFLRGSSYTLADCQDECLQDPGCLGIDFGKDSSFGYCYFNVEQAIEFTIHSKYDAWKKTTICNTTNSTGTTT